MKSKTIYNSPNIKEFGLPLKRPVCQTVSEILGYIASEEEQLNNNDDF